MVAIYIHHIFHSIMTTKIVVLIDGGYFDSINYYLKQNRKKKIDVEKLSLKVVRDGLHLRTKFYHAYPYQSEDPTEEEKAKYTGALQFFHSIGRLRNHEFCNVGRVKQKRYNCPKCNSEFIKRGQKGVDVALALDLVKMARKRVADEFVLISGDEDLTSAVEMAQEELCNVIVYYVYDIDDNMYVSKKLTHTASDRVRMDLGFLEECAIDES